MVRDSDRVRADLGFPLVWNSGFPPIQGKCASNKYAFLFHPLHTGEPLGAESQLYSLTPAPGELGVRKAIGVMGNS